MQTCAELHAKIIASVLGGRVTQDKTVVKQFETPIEALNGFQNACNTLVGMNFKECESLLIPNRNIVRMYEKGHWPYIMCLTVENDMLVVTLSSKVKIIEELVSSL